MDKKVNGFYQKFMRLVGHQKTKLWDFQFISDVCWGPLQELVEGHGRLLDSLEWDLRRLRFKHRQDKVVDLLRLGLCGCVITVML